MTEIFTKQLKAVITEYDEALNRSRHEDGSDIIGDVSAHDLRTRCLAAIERIAGRTSVYYAQATPMNEEKWSAICRLPSPIGAPRALIADIEAGYLKSLVEIIHGDVFADFLEMAAHLLESGYKDAAAVIAGSTLENHLRQLAAKHVIPTDDGGKSRNADRVNADLVKAKVYSKQDQKSVTAWLGLRNNAAHGDYSAYEQSQVRLMVDAIRDFIMRHPS